MGKGGGDVNVVFVDLGDRDDVSLFVVLGMFWAGFLGKEASKEVLVGRKQLLSLDSVCSCLSQVIHK